MTISASTAAEWVAPRMKGWEDVTRTTNILQWYMDRELCGIATEDDRILGVACVRFLKQAKDGLEPYKHDSDGAWTWVELVVADQGVAISRLFNLLWDKYGRRPLVAYRRGLKDGRVRTFTIKMFDRMNALSERRTALHGGSKQCFSNKD
ncbi:MAG: hypothetical protein EBZ69_01285 [Alphaproteobacteria bacterium]|nr:hypothetical protein [Alphaproteobacteria bacterium]